jgi:RNA polymerase sigma factor (sigma-70 family)
MRGEMAQVFNHAALRLGVRQRVAFILTEMEGFTSEEAAKLMDISASTVRNLTAQARAGLRTALREFFPEYVPAAEGEETEHE